jgi:hypothetical protein
MATTINPLRYARRMETAGLPRAQAEAIAEGVADELESNLEQRLERIETAVADLRAEVGELRTGFSDLRGEVRTAVADLRGEIARSRVDTLRWLVPLLLTLILAVLAQASGTFFLILRATGSLPG